MFLIAFGGLAVMLVPSVGRMNSLGLWFAFAASLLFAVTFFLGAQVTRKVAPRNMTFWVTVVGFVIIVPAVYFSDALALPQTVVGWSALGAATALYFGGILAQFTALSRAPAAQASVVMNLGTDRVGNARRMDSRRAIVAGAMARCSRGYRCNAMVAKSYATKCALKL